MKLYRALPPISMYDKQPYRIHEIEVKKETAKLYVVEPCEGSMFLTHLKKTQCDHLGIYPNKGDALFYLSMLIDTKIIRLKDELAQLNQTFEAIRKDIR